MADFPRKTLPAGSIGFDINQCRADGHDLFRTVDRGSAMQFARSSGLNRIPSATGGIARLACAWLDEMGKDPIGILSKAGLTRKEVRDPAIRLEARTQINLLELAAEEVQHEWLGFHLARSFDLRKIGLVYYVIASSDRLADALRNAERYSQINNEGVRLRFSMQGGTAAIALDYVNVDRNADRHQIEFWLVTLVRICRQVTNSRLAPSRLKTRHSRMGRQRNSKHFLASTSNLVLTPTRSAFRDRLPCFLRGTRRIPERTVAALAEEALARKPRERITARSKAEDVLQTTAARQSHGIGSCAAAWDELANFVAQACRGGYFLRGDIGPVAGCPCQALSP